jgi:hypothetical protein
MEKKYEISYKTDRIFIERFIVLLVILYNKRNYLVSEKGRDTWHENC